MAGGRDAIDPLTAGHDADAEGAVVGRHLLDLDDLARHRADRRAPIAETRARMAWPPHRSELEARDRVAPRDHAAVGPPRFRHQHITVPCGLRLDQVARRGAADLFVAG